MTAQAISRQKSFGKSLSKSLGKSRGLVLALAGIAVLAVAAGFVSYVLWPTWPKPEGSLDAPSMPITVAGVLFNVPPATVRAAVQRHPGAHERIDLGFAWPSLRAPDAAGESALPPPAAGDGETAPTPMPKGNNRLFVTIAGLGAVLPPETRLRSIYPRYIETQAVAGPDGLAIVSFRTGTPYEGEDLVYLADKPEQFFARCSRATRNVPGTCIQERLIDAAEITLRFPRDWLQDWRSVAAGFDRLLWQLHARVGSPQGGGG
jgi:hypothetical protein